MEGPALKSPAVQEEKATTTDSTNHSILDELIISIGQFGRFQKINYFLLCLPIICNAFYSISYAFTASDVVHRCNISQCDSPNSAYDEPWLNFTIPRHNGEWSACDHYESTSGLYGSCDAQHFSPNKSKNCESGFKLRDRENTISSEFGIFCEDRWKLSMVGTVNNIGQFIGIPIGGYLSDRYGRKMILIVTGVLSALCGLIRSFSINYYMFISLEFLDMAVGSTLFPTAFLLAIELVGPKLRTVSAASLCLTYSLGEAGMGYLASYLLDWRMLLRFLYTPALLHLTFIFYLPESIRWLLSQTREEEAIQTLQMAAKVNQRDLPEAQLQQLIYNNRQLQVESKVTEGHYSARQIWNSLGLRIAQCCFLWITNTLIALGLTLNSVSLGGDKFQNFIIISLMQMPGNLLATYIMQRFGRRRSLCLCMSFCTILLLATAILAVDFPVLSQWLYFLAKMFSTASFMILYFFTSEMFPTSCRNSLLSFCSMVGRFGSMLAPQTPLLTHFHKYAPHMLFATFGTISSFLALFFPETANKALPATLEEARALDRNMPMRQPKEPNKLKSAM